MHRVVALCLLLPSLAGCSTYIENRRSEDFVPIYDAMVPEMNQPAVSGAIFNASAKTGLFTTDQRARTVGDILTISFVESFAATKSQSTQTARDDTFGVTLPFNQSALQNKLTAGGSQSFSGSGQAAQSNSFTGQLSVSVVRVYSNGNMEVMGQKMITLNNGNEYIRVRGIVRPEDISADNIVRSSKLADAKITYTGAGDVADTGKPGWLSQILRAVAPF